MQIIEVKNKEKINVSAGIFVKDKDLLFTSRKKNKIYSNCFEFPGGKVEKGETNFQALKREIMEELSIKIISADLFSNYSYKFNGTHINLNFFLCSKWIGKFKPLEKQKIQWINILDVNSYEILPSNKKVILKMIKFLTDYSTSQV